MIAKGEAAQRSWRTQHLSDDAMYARGATSASIKATKGSTRTTVVSIDGRNTISTQGRIVDFIVDVSQLTTFSEPQVGDRITHDSQVFEVCHGVDGARAWVWSGRDNKTYRIHTIKSVSLRAVVAAEAGVAAAVAAHLRHHLQARS